jgi:hypothetical protein
MTLLVHIPLLDFTPAVVHTRHLDFMSWLILAASSVA